MAADAGHPKASRTFLERRRKGPVRRWPFVVRWVFAVSLAMLGEGFVEYKLAEQQLLDRALQDSLKSYEALAGGLEEILAAGLAPAQRDPILSRDLRRIRSSHGTVDVRLFNAAGTLVAGTGPDDGPDAGTGTAAGVREALASGHGSVGRQTAAGSDDQAAAYEFFVPLASPEGTLVLKVDRRQDIVTGLHADLRARAVFNVVLSILVVVPLSYLLGGRSLHRTQMRAERDAATDALTGLAGRRPFRPALEKVLADAAEFPVILALIDLDGFKQVNDRFGHGHGDSVLVGLADSFEELRSGDTAYRLGGDEFAVVMPGTDQDQAVQALDRVWTAFTTRFPGLGFSCGIASLAAGEPMALQELMERSDAALYEAKRRGRNPTVTFDDLQLRPADVSSTDHRA